MIIKGYQSLQYCAVAGNSGAWDEWLGSEVTDSGSKDGLHLTASETAAVIPRYWARVLQCSSAKLYRFIIHTSMKLGRWVCGYDKNCIPWLVWSVHSWTQSLIATTIRDMGFEVYLALDELSWTRGYFYSCTAQEHSADVRYEGA